MAYTLTGRKGGTVRFIPFENGIIESESETYSSSVTTNPIEDGADINDHVTNDAGTFSVAGTIVGGDSAISALMGMRNARDIMTYTGLTRVSNLVFTSLQFDRSYQNEGGSSFTASFTRVQTVFAEYVAPGADTPMTAQDSGKSQNALLAKTSNAGTKAVASASVSASSAEKFVAAYNTPSSSAPLNRVTSGFSGVAAG